MQEDEVHAEERNVDMAAQRRANTLALQLICVVALAIVLIVFHDNRPVIDVLLPLLGVPAVAFFTFRWFLDFWRED